jgi:hypothetical protein
MDRDIKKPCHISDYAVLKVPLIGAANLTADWGEKLSK